MSDSPPKEHIADDPDFLAEIEELDRGLFGGRSAAQGRSPAQFPGKFPAGQPSSAAEFQAAFQSAPEARALPAAAAPDSPAGTAPPARPLLELFPPAPARPASASTPPVQRAGPPPVAPAAEGDRPPSPPSEKPGFAAIGLPGRIPDDLPLRTAPAMAVERVPAAEYETFYGLKEAPFGSMPDPKFLYQSVSHEAALAQMLGGVRNRERIVLLVGDAGVGKTLLCRAAAGRFGTRVLTSFVADPPATPEELLRSLLVDFGIISHDEVAKGRLIRATHEDLVATLGSFLALLGPLQMSAVAVIDNAHRLSRDVLGLLPQLSELGGEPPALQMLLAGEMSFLQTLDDPALKSLDERVSRKIFIEPLDVDEVVAYVHHRMQVAGSSGRLQFSAGAGRRLFELSAGVQAVINRVCDRALALGYEVSASSIGSTLVDRAGRDLGIVSPGSPIARVAGLTAAVVTVVVLVLIGAAGAATVFHDRLVALMAVPEPPPAPTLRAPAPIEPLPVPALDEGAIDSSRSF